MKNRHGLRWTSKARGVDQGQRKLMDERDLPDVLAASDLIRGDRWPTTGTNECVAVIAVMMMHLAGGGSACMRWPAKGRGERRPTRRWQVIERRNRESV